jgi:hypothetical protein
MIVREPVSLRLIDSTIEASLKFATKKATAAGAASSAAAALARGVLQAMTFSKIKILGAAAVAGVLALGGAKTLARQFGTAGQVQPRETTRKAQPDRADALLQSTKEIEQILTDMERQHLDLRRQIQSIRDQIAALRAARPGSRMEAAAGAASPPETATSNASQPPGATTRSSAGEPAKDQKVSSSKDKPQGERGRRRSTEKAAAGATAPFHVDFGQHIYVSSPSTDRIAIFNMQSGESQLLDLPLPEGSKRSITPIVGPEALALNILNKGGIKITRIAVYSMSDPLGSQRGGWHLQELREPVDSASPVVGQGSVAYVLGRYVYAFSTRANNWDVLELPAATKPQLSQSDNVFKVEHGSHLYTFSVNAGEWKDLDYNAILYPRPEEQPRGAK